MVIAIKNLNVQYVLLMNVNPVNSTLKSETSLLNTPITVISHFLTDHRIIEYPELEGTREVPLTPRINRCT